MDGGVSFAAAAVHLKRCGTKSAHDEIAIAVGRAVKIILLVRSHPGSADEDAVRMRMSIEVPELRLIERGFDGVVAGRFIRGIPIGRFRTGDDVDRIALLGKFRVVNRLARLRFGGVDFAGPAWNGNTSAGYLAGGFILSDAQ